MPNGSELTDAEYAALADFRYTLRQFQAFSEERVVDFGLTPQQHQVLLTIRGAAPGPVSIGYVAERLFVKPHSASGLVVRLEALGLIARQASPHDGRQALLQLTPSARQLLDQLSAVHRDEIVRMRPMLKNLLDSIA